MKNEREISFGLQYAAEILAHIPNIECFSVDGLSQWSQKKGKKEIKLSIRAMPRSGVESVLLKRTPHFSGDVEVNSENPRYKDLAKELIDIFASVVKED